MNDPLLWNLDEAARQLGDVSTRTVRRMLERGELPDPLIEEDDIVIVPRGIM